MRIELEGKQVLLGVLITILLLGTLVALPMYTYKLGKDSKTTCTYRPAKCPVCPVCPETPENLDINLNSKGDCIMITQPGDKEGTMRCKLT